MLELYKLTKATVKILTGLQETGSKIERETSQY